MDIPPDFNDYIQTAQRKFESFIVNKLGNVPGIAPVSIASSTPYSYLCVFDDAFFNKKILIYRLDDLNQPYRKLKGAVSSLDYVRFSDSAPMLAAANYFSQFQFSGFTFDVEENRFTPVLGDRYWGKASIGGGSSMFALNPDNSLMVIASSIVNNSRLKIFDLGASSAERPGLITMNPPGKLFVTKSLRWSPDGKIVAHHGHYTNQLVPPENLIGVFLWKIERNSTTLSVGHMGTLTYQCPVLNDNNVDLAFSPDSQSLVLGADKKSSDKLKLFNLNTQQLVFESAPLNATTISLVFTPDGKHLFSGEQDGCVRIWNVEPAFLTLNKTINFAGEIFQICLSTGENRLLVAHQDGRKTVAVSSVSLPREMLN